LVMARKLPCAGEWWRAYQEGLLNMNQSSVDRAVAKFNEDLI
jgi:hypothetical protein